MDPVRHKTQKNPITATKSANYSYDTDDKFKNLLETSARDAYSRAWHRIERGLR